MQRDAGCRRGHVEEQIDDAAGAFFGRCDAWCAGGLTSAPSEIRLPADLRAESGASSAPTSHSKPCALTIQRRGADQRL